ncbi:MAG: efflux RND transporter permease subunit, partial [Planctomycetes bacterium]|nr:efflux RND transporter permease subunit [Planctomycetota bacterium]
VGFIKQVADLEQVVLKNDGHTPVLLRDVARVQLGPEFRRGALADQHGEKVGGVVTIRYGANPQQVIENVKAELAKLEPALPEGVTITPFYDRTKLIDQTLDNLRSSLLQQLLITALVSLIFLLHLRSALIIGSTLPLSVLAAFIAMEAFGIGSNIMSLAGISIAIGEVTDLGIVMVETIYRGLQQDNSGSPRWRVVLNSARSEGRAVLTAAGTTLLSFMPVFFLPDQSYKLFAPLAWTKTFTLAFAAVLAVTLMPVLCLLFLGRGTGSAERAKAGREALRWVGALAMAGLWAMLVWRFRAEVEADFGLQAGAVAVLGGMLVLLAVRKLLGERLTGVDDNPVARGIVRVYAPILRFFLRHKAVLAGLTVIVILLGASVLVGARKALWPVYAAADAVLPQDSTLRPLDTVAGHFPGMGTEFMPPFDEGDLLYMPSLLSQASLSETMEAMQWQNRQIAAVPEVETVVGKLGRADTSLDPAPIGMVETILQIKPRSQWRKAVPRERLAALLEGGWQPADLLREMREGEAKQAVRQALDGGLALPALAREVRDARPLSEIRPLLDRPAELTLGERVLENLSEDLSKQRLVADLRAVTHQPGVAPSWLHPIETRIVMLSSGIRARIGLEIWGDDADRLAELALQFEPIIKQVPGATDVTAMRAGGQPYLEYHLRRDRIAHYGLNVEEIQDLIEVALGGKRLTTTVEGRERYPVRVRYERELRDNLAELDSLLVPTPMGAQVPITELADIRHVIGPSMIRGINGKLVGYVMFNPASVDEVTLIERVDARVKQAIEKGDVDWPKGYSYRWVGQYQEALRAGARLRIIVPLVVLCIFLLVFLHFRKLDTALIVFSGVPVAIAGGLIGLRYWPWLQSLLRDAPQGPPIYLTVAVAVGFISVLGVTTDDGVVMGTYIEELHHERKPATVAALRETVVAAGCTRIRPALMTAATTLIGLSPLLWTTGRGSDVLQPMALPAIGGTLIELISIFIVPVAMCWRKERLLRRAQQPMTAA